MPEHEPEETLSYRTPAGAEVTRRVVAPADPDDTAGPGIRTRFLRDPATGEWLLQRRLIRAPQRGRADPGEARLDAETQAGLRLARRYPGRAHPPALPRIIGYRPDIAEPYVLWEPPAGQVLDEVAGRLDIEGVEQVLRDLLGALVHLSAAGIVHRGLRPDTVRWTDTGAATIAGFDDVALAGTPRTPLGDPPWASAEQVRGLGETDPRDDVWSVAALLGALLGRDDETLRDRLGPRYGVLLGEALAARAGQRPPAADLLRALSWPVPATGHAVSAALDAGRRRYDEVSRRHDSAAPSSEDSAPRPRRSPFRRRKAPRPAPAPVPRRDCYLCLDPVEWTETDVFFMNSDGGFEELDVRALGTGPRREDRLRHAFRRCPNPTGDTVGHFLPAAYLRGGPPINVGLIGDSGAGKTHLLAGILKEIEAGALGGFGLTTGAVDIAWHDDFRKNRINPLYEQGLPLEYTRRAEDVDFADGLLLGTGAASRPLMFFDIAGEMLAPEHQRGRATRFLAVIDALIFVADPVRDEPDVTFEAVLDRLSHRAGADGLIDVPAAVVVAKSDMRRFDEPVDAWIGRDDLNLRREHPELAAAETRDGYAYLHSLGRIPQLAPVDRCRRATVHFASATAGPVRNGRFQHGARPQRCAQPLVSLLDMAGALPASAHRDDEAV